MFAVRGIVFSHEAVRAWEAKLTPALAEDLRWRRRGKVGRSWYVDETYLKVHGRWCYLYRAIDRNGNLGQRQKFRVWVGHDGWKGAQPCPNAKSLIFLMLSWTSFWLGPIPRRPLI